MPKSKDEFEQLYPCDFYEPDELLDAEKMYSVYEIARLMQGLDADADIDVETEEILLDWAIPWVIVNADDLVIGEPESEDEPGYYGLKTDE